MNEEPRASTDLDEPRNDSRWFAAIDPDAAAPPAPLPRFPRHAVPLALAGLAALLCPRGPTSGWHAAFSYARGPTSGWHAAFAFANKPEVRASLTTGLLAAAAVVVVHWLAARRAARARPSSDKAARGLAVEGDRVAFVAGGSSQPVGLTLDAPFGVTLLASPRRERVIALLSSAQGTFYLGSSFDAPARRAFAPLLDRAFTVVGDDAGMEAIAPDGAPLVLAPEELASLLDVLVERSPNCLERFVLTDARGALITLDGQKLRVGERAVDLSAPLEWKPIVFQEAFGQAIAVYQGTWIRQSATELTLVSLMPALGPASGADGTELDLGTLDRAVLRDLRLMQATPEAPPPNDQRIAIDRLFMLPVRSALDSAPRPSQTSLRTEPARA